MTPEKIEKTQLIQDLHLIDPLGDKRGNQQQKKNNNKRKHKEKNVNDEALEEELSHNPEGDHIDFHA